MGMDVFLLPSLFEGFPIVGLEAQCAGLPCIFNSSITDEIKICDTVHFLPVSNGSLRWAEEVVRLLHASSQRKNESQVLFQNGYTNQQNVKSVQTAITQALKKRTEDVVKKRE
jgi:glycosyltransferase involved in cell wall biosynthesis